MTQVRVPIGGRFPAPKLARRGCSASDECPHKRPNDPNSGLETCGRTPVQMTDAGSVPGFTTNSKSPSCVTGFFASAHSASSGAASRADLASVTPPQIPAFPVLHGISVLGLSLVVSRASVREATSCIDADLEVVGCG